MKTVSEVKRGSSCRESFAPSPQPGLSSRHVSPPVSFVLLTQGLVPCHASCILYLPLPPSGILSFVFFLFLTCILFLFSTSSFVLLTTGFAVVASPSFPATCQTFPLFSTWWILVRVPQFFQLPCVWSPLAINTLFSAISGITASVLHFMDSEFM